MYRDAPTKTTPVTIRAGRIEALIPSLLRRWLVRQRFLGTCQLNSQPAEALEKAVSAGWVFDFLSEDPQVDDDDAGDQEQGGD